MPILIREVRENELDTVLALNNAAGPTILPLTLDQLRFSFQEAAYFRVAESGGRIVGFLIAYDEDSHYASSNYRWLKERYPHFIYIDRVVIASAQRGGGVGRVFYADVTSFAEVRKPVLTCEVFLEHDADPVRLFHGSFGFREIGQHVMPENGIRASMMAKDMCSYPWVREAYGDALPDEPWLSRPRVPVAQPSAETAGA